MANNAEIKFYYYESKDTFDKITPVDKCLYFVKDNGLYRGSLLIADNAQAISSGIVGVLEEHQKAIEKNAEDISNNSGKIDANSEAITALETKNGSQDSDIAGLRVNLGEEVSRLEELIEKTNSGTRDALGADIASNLKKINANTKSINSNKDATDALAKRVTANEKSLKTKASTTDVSGLDTKITNLTARVSTNETDITNLKTAIGEHKETLDSHKKRIDSLNTALVGEQSSREALATTVASNTKRIKDCEDNILDLQTAQNDLEGQLASKANTSTLNTVKTNLEKSIATKANTSDVNTALGLKADKTALATKANASSVYTKTEINNKISTINTALGSKANSSDVTTKLKAKADKTTVADLNESVQSAVGKVSQFEQDMQDLNTDFSVLSGTVEDNTEKISANSTSITGLVTRVEEAEEALALKATAGDVASEIDRIEQAYKAADNALDVKISANTRLIGEKETALDNKITENTKSIQANSIAISGKASQSDLNDLKEMVDTHEESITDSIDPALTNHTERIGVLENDLKELLDATIPGIVKKEADDHSEQANSINAINTALEGKSDRGHNHDDMYYTETEIDQKLSTVNSSITNITSGSTPVKEAEHAESADTATNANHATSADSATSATKATQDASGNTITSTYATKSELNTAKSNLQASIDAKQSTITGGASTITGSNLTANRALISNGSGKVGVSAVTSTELGYLDGVTSSVQTQLDNKAPIANGQYAVTTAGTGAAYTATVPSIKSLTAGVSFIMIPNTVSTTTAPTLNVNRLGAKSIKRRLSNLPTSLQNGYSNAWLAQGKPFRVVYDGTAWIVEGHEKPSAADLYGLTATITELNYCDGVTSSIQTQLNALSSRIAALETILANDVLAINV